jgi:UDP-N-acetylmuramyl pentapeptide synthase
VVSLDEVKLNDEGFLTFKWQGQAVTTNLIGRQYLSAVMAAIAVGQEFGVPTEKILEAVETFQPGDNYIQQYRLRTGTRVIDDGKTANPRGFEAALELLDTVSAQQKILVTSGIVDLGAQSEHIHQQLAQQADAIVNQVWYVGAEGQAVFKQVLSERCLVKQTEILDQVLHPGPDMVILLEGRMPGWFSSALSEMQD